ncbi:MAG: S-methyl-5-thioribose-1-phosphate isomerase [Mogibacterium sp.]|nr:S-methyl-5-thioribose-1-phosphate isomerase [Mogibacterium sp.]
MNNRGFETIRYRNGRLYYLDQTRLPQEEVMTEAVTPEDVWEAIRHLKVRGAPAIGVFAAYGMVLSAQRSYEKDGTVGDLVSAGHYLMSARPTAVNLEWAVRRMLARYAGLLREEVHYQRGLAEELTQEEKTARVRHQIAELLREAIHIRLEDAACCQEMAENGLKLLEPGMGILTHCNAGALATTGMGTALGPIYLGQERGYDFRVFADETRPLLQGARLTAWELQKAGVDVTLICDNMASTVMKQGKVRAVLVGCDRMAANGDAANKIGTSGLAVLAKEYGIPFYICVPTSSIDPSIETGEEIVIEERDPEEIRSMWYEQPMAPEGISLYNPAFDVTDHQYLTAIITEEGVIYPPFREGIAEMIGLGPQEEPAAEASAEHMTLEIV